MPAFIDLTGKQFGRLTVVRQTRKHIWECRCECGAVIERPGPYLRCGDTASCGCLRRELAAAAHTVHGMRADNRYCIWKKMIQRCTNPNDPDCADYGGRGIRVCHRWAISFLDFCEDMGPRPTPKHSIDRIDTNGDYEPGNCRWATDAQQTRNKRSNIWVVVEGQRMILKDACMVLGLQYRTICARISNGMDSQTALTFHRKEKQDA